MSGLKSTAPRPPAEIADAIQALSDADWIRLRKVANAYSRGRSIEAEDLLQEAMRRALDGGRNCPAHVGVVKFLAEVMRSIAHAAKETAAHQPQLVPVANHSTAETAVDPPDPAPGAEENLQGNQEIVAILALFDDDETAQIILEGMMEGMRGEELKELTDLDETAYQSKRRLIRRRITKGLTEGRTS